MSSNNALERRRIDGGRAAVSRSTGSLADIS
jgi:hypothetical protein